MQTGKSEHRAQSVSGRNELFSVFVFDCGTVSVIAIVIIHTERSVDLFWMFSMHSFGSERFWGILLTLRRHFGPFECCSSDTCSAQQRVVSRYSLRRVQLHSNLFDIISFNLQLDKEIIIPVSCCAVRCWAEYSIYAATAAGAWERNLVGGMEFHFDGGPHQIAI